MEPLVRNRFGEQQHKAFHECRAGGKRSYVMMFHEMLSVRPNVLVEAKIAVMGAMNMADDSTSGGVEVPG